MQFELKALYSVPELAEMAEVSRDRMIRILRSHDVKLKLSGRRFMVPLSELEEKLSWLRDSMETRDLYKQASRGEMPR